MHGSFQKFFFPEQPTGQSHIRAQMNNIKMRNPIESTLYNGLCSHIKEDIYETDKWAGLVHLQGGICDEKQREINIKYPWAGTVMGLSGLILFTFR